MQPADVATALARLEELTAEQQRALSGIQTRAAEIAALSASLALPTPLATLSRLLQQLALAPDQPALARILCEAASQLLPDSRGALSLGGDGTEPALLCAWSGERRWSLGQQEPAASAELLQEIAAQPVETARRLPLTSLGLSVGELRVWTASARADTARLLADCAGPALGALALKHRLGQRTVRDALTGLFNRRYLEDTLARELHRARRNDAPLGLLLFDIDQLDAFNARHGTDAGDRLLEAVAGLLQASFRGSDVCCRDGQRFWVVLPDASLADALRRAEEILALIPQLRLPRRAAPCAASACAGVAASPEHADAAEPLLLAAEAALYLAKQDGPGRARRAEKPR